MSPTSPSTESAAAPRLEGMPGLDYAGARRGRRAFRFCVLSCLFFTFTLWFAENHLRYEKSESQYRMALTLQDASARPILRQVLRRDAETNEVPSAKYVEALAAVEEADIVLERYQEAYSLNPDDAFLVLNYGTHLYLASRYKEARERFREAGVQPPKNALPRYLEAAALAAGAAGDEEGLDEALTEAFALIARTNTSGDPVLFPQPLWHPSLPKDGMWYAGKRREIAGRCCAPLNRFRSFVRARALALAESGASEEARARLMEMDKMGRRLLGDAGTGAEHLGIPQALAGTQLQFDAARARVNIAEALEESPAPGLIEGLVKSRELAQALGNFDDARASKTKAHQARIAFPLGLLAKGFLPLAMFYAAVFLASGLLAVDRKHWALPHVRLGKSAFVGGFATTYVFLFACAFWPSTLSAAEWERVDPSLRFIWFAWVGLLVAFGLAYPWIAARPLVRWLGEAPSRKEEWTEKHARKQRMGARFAFSRRCFGILCGGYLCVACVWAVSYRLIAGSYPWQLELLVTDLREQELALIHQVQQVLNLATYSSFSF